MRKMILIFLIFITALTGGCSRKPSIKNAGLLYHGETDYTVNMKRDALCLMAAYPEHITGVKKQGLKVYFTMKSGKQLLYDDEKSKNFYEKLNDTDIQDMMEQIYPLGNIKSIMADGYDPGRFRVYALFKELYGNSKEQTEHNLTTVKTAFGYLQFNKNNNAAGSLKSVFDDLIPLAQKNNLVRSSVLPLNGTFNYRYISGTNLLSPHSFGIAIDLGRDGRDYWKWASKSQGEKRISSYPQEVVNVFEKNGFIWGGKWCHFDIMHFEYRPEIILKARYFGENSPQAKPWYYGAPYDDAKIKNYIDIIDNALK
ncbi:MAG: M15 family metallopeptidase [Clostridiales bacterium]|nr:M15 family metallopeptidase [Clostridiales bacterium]